jgi:glycosyltransferase involved in cell wall biosynthesis
MTVSIIIPMYNAAPWIKETLESVARQTYPKKDIEVIVVDDQSTDGSPDIARSVFEEHSLNGRVIPHERNGGCGAPRNAGFEVATGDWVNFLDADDLLAPRKLELQMACAAQATGDVAVVYSPWRHYSLLDGKWQPSGPLIGPIVDDEPVLRILEEFYFGYVGPTLIRSSFVSKIGGFDGSLRLGEDYDLMLRAAMAGAGFRQAPSREPLFFYRETPGSLWRVSTKRIEPMRRLARISKTAENFLREKHAGGLSERARRALASRYGRLLDFFFEHDRPSFDEALGWIRDLGHRDPPDLNRNMRIVSKLIGYENAQGLRLSYRRAKGKVSGLGRRVTAGSHAS